MYEDSYAYTWCVKNSRLYELIVELTCTIKNGEVTITGCTGTDTVIEIPATIEDCR